MDLKIFTNNIEDSAKEQINTLMQQEAFKNAKVRIMPDVHSGKGCVIGFTSEFKNKIIPNIVGVDIGCGVICCKLKKKDFTDTDLKELDDFIKTHIPSSMDVLNQETELLERDTAHKYIDKLYCFNELHNVNRLYMSLSTLGGGNHFIELDTDEEGNIYLIVHTGSRNLGKQVAEIYQQKAIDKFYTEPLKHKIDALIKELKAQGRNAEIELSINNVKKHYAASELPKELCYLIGTDAAHYLHDMFLCQEFAKENRKMIVDKICKFLNDDYVVYCESVHNYIDAEDNIIRKGAISAKKGQHLIIPLNMRDGCILGIGKGNADWNQSAPHGAGRLMSRTEARRDLRLSDFKEVMTGIFTSTADETTIDEAPMAYKNDQEIIDAVKDTIEITQMLKPIYNFKASEIAER